MFEKQGSKELELSYGVITGSRCLHALTARNTHADMSLNDHRDIVCSVTHSECHLLWEALANHLHYVALLLG